jgi:hypothetical protein
VSAVEDVMIIVNGELEWMGRRSVLWFKPIIQLNILRKNMKTFQDR